MQFTTTIYATIALCAGAMANPMPSEALESRQSTYPEFFDPQPLGSEDNSGCKLTQSLHDGILDIGRNDVQPTIYTATDDMNGKSTKFNAQAGVCAEKVGLWISGKFANGTHCSITGGDMLTALSTIQGKTNGCGWLIYRPDRANSGSQCAVNLNGVPKQGQCKGTFQNGGRSS